MTTPLDSPFDLPFDAPPGGAPDVIHAIADGSGPPPYHVRDQEARILALPPCEVAPADRAALAPVAFHPYPATIWLPAPESTEPTEVPDATWQGWDWPTDDGLVIGAGRDEQLPGLYALEGYGPDARRAEIAGRPVSVWRYGSVGETGVRRHRAIVAGFLDDATRLHADIFARSPAARDALLAALLTLAPRGR
jgi:hypothetical protein